MSTLRQYSKILTSFLATAAVLLCVTAPETLAQSETVGDAVALSSAVPAPADEMLTIGSKAPKIDIEHWFSDRQGTLPRITGFEPDKVYVIEFWATWCGPCIFAMPHLVELQDKFVDKGVQVISISDEDADTVSEFLKREVRGSDEENQTYADLTSAYCLTADPDQSVYKEYFEASGQRGIPTAFIVGKTGLIEWIGHPMEMDEPLEQVVAGSWDRAAYAEKIKEEQKMMAAMAELEDVLDEKMNEIGELIEAGKPQEGLALLDEMIADEEMAPLKPMLDNIRKSLLIQFVGGEEGAVALKEMADELKQMPEVLIGFTQQLYDGHRESPRDKVMLAAIADLAKLAAEKSPKNALIRDQQARMLLELEKLDEAIKVQEKAVELADENEKAEFEAFLKELRAKKAG